MILSLLLSTSDCGLRLFLSLSHYPVLNDRLGVTKTREETERKGEGEKKREVKAD
jgi:hypothetical protein